MISCHVLFFGFLFFVSIGLYVSVFIYLIIRDQEDDDRRAWKEAILRGQACVWVPVILLGGGAILVLGG